MLRQKIRIALADDHKQVREIWNFILSSNPIFEVVAVCCNGREAIEAAAVYEPDVFMMDINMDIVNGIEATGNITKNHPGIRVIGMSIHLDNVYIKSMMDAGAQGYITKNTPYEEVINAIMLVHEGQRYICKEAQRFSIASSLLSKN